MPSIPTLETLRLKLRGHQAEDLAAATTLWTDPQVIQYTTGQPSSRQEVWFRILRYIGHWNLLNYGYWAIEEKNSGAFIGELGFADFKRIFTPSIEGVPELGWALLPAVHGLGYATEALQAVTAWGDKNLGAARTVCLINPENVRSLRVAAKVGYREELRGSLVGQPVILLERSKTTTASGDPTFGS